MTSALRASARYWLAGLAFAAAGVIVTRVLAPVFDDAKIRAGVALTGELVALAGLGVIMLGIRRRIRLAEQSLAAAATE